jgi:hypothetical protein
MPNEARFQRPYLARKFNLAAADLTLTRGLRMKKSVER